MAAQIFQNNHEISKQEVQTAIAKAVELRAIHAALLHGNSPANLKLPSSASPSILRTSDQFSAQDYPVFTPVSASAPLFFFFLGFSALISFSMDFWWWGFFVLIFSLVKAD